MAALPRPSSTLVPSFAATRDYYAARDTVDLERAELVRIISWTRKMAIKLTGMALLLGLLVWSLVYFPLAIDCNKAVSLIINGWNRVVSDG